MNGETLSTTASTTGEKTNEEITTNSTTEQTQSEESGNTSGQTLNGDLNSNTNYSEIYDMLKERDTTIDKLKSEVTELKKANTQLLLRVNASSQSNAIKDPFESLIDFMNER